MGSQVPGERGIELGRGDILGTLLVELLEASLGLVLELTVAAAQLLRHLLEALILSLHILELAGKLTDAPLAFIKAALLALRFAFEVLDLLANGRKIFRAGAIIRSDGREGQNHRAEQQQAL
jgi:hypothetical protein